MTILKEITHKFENMSSGQIKILILLRGMFLFVGCGKLKTQEASGETEDILVEKGEAMDIYEITTENDAETDRSYYIEINEK